MLPLRSAGRRSLLLRQRPTPAFTVPSVRGLHGSPTSFAAASALPTIPHSDLAYRALLRNLGLLSGMRQGKTHFRVAATGLQASVVAQRMAAMEKAVDFELSGNDVAADFGE